LLQAGWPQSQAISASSDPASLQDWLQYFSPCGATQMQGTWAHLLDLSAAIVDLLKKNYWGVSASMSESGWELGAPEVFSFPLISNP
jgi:hypothetical protein